jgi:hypothetical protein
LTTLPLQSWPKASPFWIMLLLSVGALEHQAAGNATDDQRRIYSAPHCRRASHDASLI